jgi:uncharacterized small protein (DUF1192 family)
MEPWRAIGQDGFMTVFDEDLPENPKKRLVAPLLDKLSVDELNAYISALEAEILRVRGAIAAKEAHKAAAAAFFKLPPGG